MKYVVARLQGNAAAFYAEDHRGDWTWTLKHGYAWLYDTREEAEAIASEWKDKDAWVEEVPDIEAFRKREDPLE